ncbi:hypothetical protein MPDQ_007934 [Monascus purpureus]|uniref:Uncharacterized protein n=1 Tax=Monascus purpureus TaxID=5098 RepID=A0A507QVH2_MONPU|nr:hypothetical protein MPDQ_007934 [Monascus purpureus]
MADSPVDDNDKPIVIDDSVSELDSTFADSASDTTSLKFSVLRYHCVIGNDLSPMQPKMVPPNVQFEVDDIESQRAFKSPFDYIHARFLASSIKDWPRLFKQTFD